MLKIIRWLLYGSAIVAGVVGLCAGGVPIGRYVMDVLRAYQDRDYYDSGNYLQEPEIIFLLSLILLIGVRIAMALDRKVQARHPDDAASSENKPAAPMTAKEPPPADVAVEMPEETADEKLTRLLNRNKS